MRAPLVLPTAKADHAADAERACISLPTELADVLIVTLEAPTGADDEDSTCAAAAEKHHKPRDKAELRAQLGDRDPYRLLELDDLRWRATADDVRKAYRRLVLKYHPDKQLAAEKKAAEAAQRAEAAGDERAEESPRHPSLTEVAEDEEDAMFKAITEAFELLSNPKKRREFDSLDDFDDSIPANFDSAKGDFFQSFAPVIERNSRWSEVQPAPLLGDADTPFAELAAFYNFWFDFKSWRDFADADEYDLADASFREERRWMERQNEKLRQKKRKDEKARLQKLVELAYSYDPRVKAMQQEEKDAKRRSKAEKHARIEEEKASAARAEAERKAQAEAEAERQKAEAAERKKVKERQAKALRKQRGRLRVLVKEHSLCSEDDCEGMCAKLAFEQLDSLCTDMEKLLLQSGGGLDAARERLQTEIRAAQANAQQEATQRNGQQAPSRTPSASSGLAAEDRKVPWTEQELTLLTKGANRFPGGVPDRWIKIAEFINHLADPSNGRTADDIIAKTKELRKEVERKAALLRAERANAASAALSAASSTSAAQSGSGPGSKAAAAAASTTKSSAGATQKAVPSAKERPPTGGQPTAKVSEKSTAKVSGSAAPAAAPKSAPRAGPGAVSPVVPTALTADAHASAPTAAAPTPTLAPASSADWAQEEQKALERALQRFPASTPDRWDRIAEAVPGKTKAECAARFKQIVAALKAKKAANSASNGK